MSLVLFDTRAYLRRYSSIRRDNTNSRRNKYAFDIIRGINCRKFKSERYSFYFETEFVSKCFRLSKRNT